MASTPSSLLFLTALTLLLLPYIHSTTPLKFTLVNNCPFTVYPAILSNAGHALIEPSGFPLPHFTHRTFDAPSSHWAGRMWGRTHCTTKPSDPNYLSCLTGDCNHQLLCSGKGGALPATLVQFSVHHGHNDQSSYSVSLVDGYNVPLTVTPHEGRGNCPVIGCKPDLIPTCPKELQFKRIEQNAAKFREIPLGIPILRTTETEFWAKSQWHEKHVIPAGILRNFAECAEFLEFSGREGWCGGNCCRKVVQSTEAVVVDNINRGGRIDWRWYLSTTTQEDEEGSNL